MDAKAAPIVAGVVSGSAGVVSGSAGDVRVSSPPKDGKSSLKLPKLDWGTLEQKFQHAVCQDQQQQPLTRKTSDERREETLRKLAMSSHDQDYTSLYKRPPKSRMQGSLELCVMNELDEGLAPSSSSQSLLKDGRLSPPMPLGGAGVIVTQEQLREEATKAFAKAKEIAQALLEAEKQQPTRTSSLVEVIGMVKPGANERLGKKELETMNLARLQVLFNAMRNEVEAFNEDLVRLLMERDELCMRKDSLLLDVEDLQQRVKELKHRQST